MGASINDVRTLGGGGSGKADKGTDKLREWDSGKGPKIGEFCGRHKCKPSWRIFSQPSTTPPLLRFLYFTVWVIRWICGGRKRQTDTGKTWQTGTVVNDLRGESF